MIKRRLELHEKLVDILGSRNVYFQPPESVKIKTPGILYVRSNIFNVDANNKIYMSKVGYDVTVIDSDPDSEVVEKLALFPGSQFIRHYTSTGHNYDVFRIYY